MLKPDKEITGKYFTDIFHECRCKNSKGNIRKFNSVLYEKDIMNI